MDAETIFTKTTKGVLAVKNKTIRMPRDLSMVFLAVDGKSTVAELAKKSGLSEGAIPAALKRLISNGYVRISADGAIANGVPADGATANGTPANGTPVNGTTANGTAANGATAKDDDDGFDLDFTL